MGEVDALIADVRSNEDFALVSEFVDDERLNRGITRGGGGSGAEWSEKYEDEDERIEAGE